MTPYLYINIFIYIYIYLYIYTQSAWRNGTHVNPHGPQYGANMGAPYGARKNLSLENKWGLCGPKHFHKKKNRWGPCGPKM